jgi:hypothetical protein
MCVCDPERGLNMKKGLSFQERWEQEEKSFKRVQLFAIGFIICVFALIVLGLITQGFIAYKFIESPEIIGDWINRFMNGVNGD